MTSPLLCQHKILQCTYCGHLRLYAILSTFKKPLYFVFVYLSTSILLYVDNYAQTIRNISLPLLRFLIQYPKTVFRCVRCIKQHKAKYLQNASKATQELAHPNHKTKRHEADNSPSSPMVDKPYGKKGDIFSFCYIFYCFFLLFSVSSRL
jgi:DNA-directed RNA polymerase subunit RPC12/RpoP